MPKPEKFKLLFDLPKEAMLSVERLEAALNARPPIRHRVKHFRKQNFYRVLVPEEDLLIAKERLVVFLAKLPQPTSRAVH